MFLIPKYHYPFYHHNFYWYLLTLQIKHNFAQDITVILKFHSS